MAKDKIVFDFNTLISRKNSSAEKYGALKKLFRRDDLLPFWVADMEFATAPVVTEAIVERAQHPIYGYTYASGKTLESIKEWNKKRYEVDIGIDSIEFTSGVMAGITASVYAFSKLGDSVVIQTPIYPPFVHTVKKNGREVVQNRLMEIDGHYKINFNELEHQFKTKKPKIMLFCSPHNPVGRVWSRDEVEKLVSLTKRYGVKLVSDEVHADIIYHPHKHTSVLSFDNSAIILNSASKSFNLAGLSTAYALINDKRDRIAFRKDLHRLHLYHVNLFGLSALEAAYSSGETWLDELLLYLENNRNYLIEQLGSRVPNLQIFVPEGTYLAWLNFNTLGLSTETVKSKLIDEAKLGLNDGVTFNSSFEGYWRFNFAVPKEMLRVGVESIIRTFG